MPTGAYIPASVGRKSEIKDQMCIVGVTVIFPKFSLVDRSISSTLRIYQNDRLL